MGMALHLSRLNYLCLVSCKIYKYCERSEIRSALIHFLLGKNNLETLHLDCASSEITIPDGAIRSHERMPALKELVLCSYKWNHSPVTAVQFWNWSRITHLELWRVPIVPFLETVKPEHLIHLRTLRTDGFSPVHLRNYRCLLLCRLLYGVKALENITLSLRWKGVDEDWKENLVRAISRHGKSLRYLNLGGWSGSGETTLRIPSNPTEMNYVAELKVWLTNIVELTLDNATIQVEKMVSAT